MKPLNLSWQGNLRTKQLPRVIRWRNTTKCMFSFLWILQRMWSNQLRRNVWEVWDMEVRNRKLYRGGLQNSGRTSKYFAPELKFCWLVVQLEPALGILPWIYVCPPNNPLQATGCATSWRWGNLETPFCKVCAEGHGNQSHQRVSGWPALCRIKVRNWRHRPPGSSHLGW